MLIEGTAITLLHSAGAFTVAHNAAINAAGCAAAAVALVGGAVGAYYHAARPYCFTPTHAEDGKLQPVSVALSFSSSTGPKDQDASLDGVLDYEFCFCQDVLSDDKEDGSGPLGVQMC